MEMSNIILILSAVLITYFLLKIIKNIIFKILLPIVMIIGLTYYLYTHYLERNILDDLTAEFCEKDESEGENFNCTCFVKIIKTDFDSKYSKQEMDKLRENPDKFNEEFYKSVSTNFDNINSCYISNGSEMSEYLKLLVID